MVLINAQLLSQESELIIKTKINPTESEYWWLEKNNFGITPSNFDLQTKWKLQTLKTSYVINIFFQSDNKKNNIYLNESFIKYHISDETFLRIGQYYRDFSNYLNDEISSGHMLISQNAKPMPKIGFVTSKKFKKTEKVNFQIGMAHGFFDRDDYYIEAPFLHEKFIYMHIKNKNYRFSWGLVHEAIWAGANPDRKFPNSLKDFIKVMIAEDGFDEGIVTHQNALGSHLAIWDFLVQKINDDKFWKLYYQHIFEDTSGLRFKNRFDGLWGFEIVNYIPNTSFLFEYLITSNQLRNPPYVNERYYRNYQYKLGWTYNNYTLGNPYINPPELENHLAINPVDVFHIGIKGEFLSNDYKIKIGRKTNISDKFQYQFSIDRNINDKFNIGLFLVNNENNNQGIGFTFFKNF